MAGVAIGKVVALWPTESRLGQAAQEVLHVRGYANRVEFTNGGKQDVVDEYCFAVVGNW